MSENTASSTDIFADLDNAAVPPVRKPGRAKGLPRVAGSGRKAGTPNRTTQDVRQMILDRGAPVDVLVSIAAGKRLRCGSEIKIVDGKPKSVPIWEQPTIEQRLKAATILLHKVAPDLKSAELTADIASRSDVHVVTDEELTPLKLAHRLAFILRDVPQAPQIIDAQASPVDDTADDCDGNDDEADDTVDDIADGSADRENGAPMVDAPIADRAMPYGGFPATIADVPPYPTLSKKFFDAFDTYTLIETLANGAVEVRQAPAGFYRIIRTDTRDIIGTAYGRDEAHTLAATLVETGAYK